MREADTPHNRFRRAGSFLAHLDAHALLGSREDKEPEPLHSHVNLDPLLECELGRRLGSHDADDPTRRWAALLRTVRLEDVADALRFRRQGYTRTQIAHTRAAEVLLMCWLPGHATAIHDHGDINARVFLVSGRAQETEYSTHGDHSRILRRRIFSAGESFRERRGGIHRVTCIGRAPLVTVHLNSPPLAVMHQYAQVDPADP